MKTKVDEKKEVRKPQQLVKLWVNSEEFAKLKAKADAEKKSISLIVYEATLKSVANNV